jgi:membrane protein DedA with SNARE-associated domain
MLESINLFIISLAHSLNINLFIFIGSIIEEIIAPIPSVLVGTIAGSLAKTQQYHYIFLFWLAIVGAVGKTIGATLLYFLADKAEDFVMIRFGKKFGVTHKEVERLGKYFNNSYRDYIIFILLRAIPVIPSPPLSIGAGIIKLNKKLYIISTFVGSVIRNIIFLFFGYTGISVYKNAIDNMSSLESILQIIIFICIGGFIVWIYYKRHKNKIDSI